MFSEAAPSRRWGRPADAANCQESEGAAGGGTGFLSNLLINQAWLRKMLMNGVPASCCGKLLLRQATVYPIRGRGAARFTRRNSRGRGRPLHHRQIVGMELLDSLVNQAPACTTGNFC